MQRTELTQPQDGVEEWLDLVDEALHGLHHALNNRIGSLSALVELHQLGEDLPGAQGLESVTADIARLEDCSRLARLLPPEPAIGEEPVTLDDVLADVFTIHRFLHDHRSVRVNIVPSRYVEPVRVERWALVRVLALQLNEAKRLARSTESIVRVATESDEEWVRVEFQIGAPLIEATPTFSRTDYASKLACVTLGGTLARRPGVTELRLPTLKARRAADRR